jgi:hypothetical protein
MKIEKYKLLIYGFVICALLSYFVYSFVLVNKSIEMFSNKIYDVLIISAGGGGTTYFMDYLLKNTDLKINDINDKDTLKHISFNRKIELNNVNCEKIIYLYNDPLLAIKSHFRRNWAMNQLKKHGNPHKLKEADVTNIDNFLEKTEKNNKDLYGIEEQYDFYMNGKINKHILFVNFNNILKNKKQIADFIGEDEHLFDNFKIKSRNSNNIDKGSKIIINIYKELYYKINKMDATIKTYI